MYRIITSLLVFATFVFAPLATSAAPITVPSDLNVGDQYRLAFVTSTSRDALSADIDDYNDFVAAVAAGVPELVALGTTWKAIGSTPSTAARDNTGTNPAVETGVRIYGLHDLQIESDNLTLWNGGIQTPITSNEQGIVVPLTLVWTGTTINGLPAGSGALGGPGDEAVTGVSSNTGNSWVNVGSLDRTLFLPLYAMSGVLTAVPEPSTLFLVCIGATAVVGWQLRRRRMRCG